MVHTRTPGPPPFSPEPPDDYGDGDRHGDDDDQRGAPLSNARLGMLIFLGAETMFFAGLVGAFLVYRTANETWPPMSMPHLPVQVTGINTLILLYSAATMWRASRAIRVADVLYSGPVRIPCQYWPEKIKSSLFDSVCSHPIAIGNNGLLHFCKSGEILFAHSG